MVVEFFSSPGENTVSDEVPFPGFIRYILQDEGASAVRRMSMSVSSPKIATVGYSLALARDSLTMGLAASSTAWLTLKPSDLILVFNIDINRALFFSLDRNLSFGIVDVIVSVAADCFCWRRRRSADFVLLASATSGYPSKVTEVF